jgi:hypothetical protein
MAQTRSHAKSCGCVNPSGGRNSKANESAIGTGAAYMNGWRRPKRERQPSESEPITGSATASTQSARKIAAPVQVPGSPSTWL